MSREKEFNLELDPSVDEVFDEVPGSSFLALRKLRWNSNSEFKLDIRKWYTKNDGEEIAGKGVSFMTEEGPSNLVNALLHHGYCSTEKVIDGIKNREDFLPIVMKTISERDPNLLKDPISFQDNGSDGEFYDPKDILN